MFERDYYAKNNEALKNSYIQSEQEKTNYNVHYSEQSLNGNEVTFPYCPTFGTW